MGVESGQPVRRTFWVALAGVVCFLAVTLGLSWPVNVLTDKTASGLRGETDLSLPFPQAWAFFTRSPQSVSVLAYRNDSGNLWIRLDTLPQSEPANIYGFSRNQRAQPTELAYLASMATFTTCDGYLSECLAREGGVSQRLRNPTNGQFFCGTMRLVNQVPVKWGYRDLVSEDTRVISFADVDVSCAK